MSSELSWYFAYGSNLKKDRLKKRVGQWKKDQKATLKGHRLTFTKGYYGHESGKANIKASPSDEVEGAVYLISEVQFRKLDIEEGVKRGVYKRILVEVESNRETLEAQTYVMIKEICSLKPSPEYLYSIIEGLKEHGYGANIIDKVLKIACIPSIFLL